MFRSGSWLLAIALLGLSGTRAAAESAGTEPTGIFVGGTAGSGTARIEHEELTRNPRTGAFWEVHAGWAPTPHWNVGASFSTWGTSMVLTPAHLHLVGGRIELTPRGAAGPFAGATGGLALTQGTIRNRSSGGVGILGGYRWSIRPWMTLGAQVMAEGHRYRDGDSAGLVTLGLHLRFHGAIMPASEPRQGRSAPFTL